MPPKGYKVRSDGSLSFPKKRSATAPLESYNSSGSATALLPTAGGTSSYYGSVTTPQLMTPHQAIVSSSPVPQAHQQQLQTILAAQQQRHQQQSIRRGGEASTTPALPPLHHHHQTTNTPEGVRGVSPQYNHTTTGAGKIPRNTGKSEDALVRPNSVLASFAKSQIDSIPHDATPFTRTLQKQEEEKREAAMMNGSFGNGTIPPPPTVKLNPQNMLQGRESVLALEADLLRRLSDLEKDSDLSKHEFVHKAQRVFDDVAVEVIRQVTVHCADRGRLLAKLWVRYSDIINTISSMFVTERTRHKEEEEKSAKELRQARLDYVRVVEHSEKALKMQFEHQEKILQEQEAREGRLCEELNALKEELYRCQVKLRGVANGTVNLGPTSRSQSLSLDQRMRRQSMMSASQGGLGSAAGQGATSAIFGVLGNSLQTNLLEEELMAAQQQQPQQQAQLLQTQVLQIDAAEGSTTSVPGGNQSSATSTLGQHIPPSPGGSSGATPLSSVPASPTAAQTTIVSAGGKVNGGGGGSGSATGSSSNATPSPKQLSTIISAGVAGGGAGSSPSPHRVASMAGSPHNYSGGGAAATEREMQLQKQVRELRMTLIDASNELMSYRNQHDLAYSRAVQTEPPPQEERAISPIQELLSANNDVSFLSAASGESTEILQVLGAGGGGGRKNMRSRQGSSSTAAMSRSLSITSSASPATPAGVSTVVPPRASASRASGGGSTSPTPPPLAALQARANSTSSTETASVGAFRNNLSRSSSRSPTLGQAANS